MESNVKPNNLVSEFWTEEKFKHSQDEWTELLKKTNADPLFLSWSWLHAWWSVCSKPSDELFIIAIYERNELIAIAPLYKENDSYFNGILRTRRLQFIGKRFSGGKGVRSEYMDIIVQTDRQELGIIEVLSIIGADTRWSELLLSDFNTSSLNYSYIKTWLNKQKMHGRIESQGHAFIVDCSATFDEYVKNLGKNTRLKLYNRRKLLETKGSVEIEYINSGNKEALFALMNDLHAQRWGGVFLNKLNKHFFNLATGFCSEKLSLKYSCVLKLDGKPISVMINIDCNDRIYNIQTGYIEGFDKRIALGTLHIGYVLEKAFNEPSIKIFDFLEGKGKNSDYKSRIAVEGDFLESSRWLRSTLLKFIFRFYDKYIRR